MKFSKVLIFMVFYMKFSKVLIFMVFYIKISIDTFSSIPPIDIYFWSHFYFSFNIIICFSLYIFEPIPRYMRDTQY